MTEMSQLAHQMIINAEITQGGVTNNTNMSEEEAMIQGFLMDMTQSQGLMTGTPANMQNVISEAKLAILEYDREQEDLAENGR